MLKVFIGTDSDFHGDAEKVIEHSIRRNTSEATEITFINPGWKSAPTGFSTHRYLIPRLCNWEGYAIYLDVDMLVLGDLAELMDHRVNGKWAIAGGDEVAIIDCSVAKNVLPIEEELKMKGSQELARNALRNGGYYADVIPLTWNSESLSETPDAKLIHYTNTRTQPWQPSPLIDYMPFPCEETYNLFFDYLEEANKPKVFRKATFKLACAAATDTGYVIECGVGTGKTLKTIVSLVKPTQAIFGFDSFDGLPEDWDMNSKVTYPAGSFECDPPDIDGVELCVGLFADTLPAWKKEHTGNISLLHIDSDLYSSAVTVLSEFNDQIVPGTVLVFDDMYETPRYTNWEQGEYKAFIEWKQGYNREAKLLCAGTLGQVVFRVTQ